MIDGYEAEAVRVAFRFATRLTAAEGITKAAGAGYSRRLAEWAQVWMPLASGICENARRMDEHLAKVQRLYDEHEARKSAAMFDVSLGRARTVMSRSTMSCVRSWFPAGNPGKERQHDRACERGGEGPAGCGPR